MVKFGWRVGKDTLMSQDALPVPSDWKSCSETVFLSFACWFFFFSFFPPLSFARDFGEEFFVLGIWKKKRKEILKSVKLFGWTRLVDRTIVHIKNNHRRVWLIYLFLLFKL